MFGSIPNLQLHEVMSLRVFPAEELALFKPQGNLLLSVLNRVRAVADVAALVKGVISADGARGGGEGIGGAKDCFECILVSEAHCAE